MRLYSIYVHVLPDNLLSLHLLTFLMFFYSCTIVSHIYIPCFATLVLVKSVGGPTCGI